MLRVHSRHLTTGAALVVSICLTACAHVPTQVSATVPLVHTKSASISENLNIVGNFTGSSETSVAVNDKRYVTKEPYLSAMGNKCFRLEESEPVAMPNQNFNAVLCQTPLGWSLFEYQ